MFIILYLECFVAAGRRKKDFKSRRNKGNKGNFYNPNTASAFSVIWLRRAEGSFISTGQF
jgi:hypothetical protein